MSKVTIIAACAACLVAGWLVGSRSTPTRTQEVITTSDYSGHTLVYRDRVEVVRATETRTITKRYWKIVQRPSETITEVTEDNGTTAREATHATEESVGASANVAERLQRTERSVVGRDDWTLGVSLRLDGDAGRYGVSLSRRILGPVSLGAWADTGRRYGLSVSVSW